MSKLGVIFAVALACHAVSSNPTRTADVNTYLVYTRANGETPVPVTATAAAIADAITITANTVFLIHGHRGSAFTSLNPGVRRAILTVEDVNVIVVDWQRYAAGSYSASVDNVSLVAASLASFITEMRTIAGLTGEIHLVGFNLGAHIAGIAGRSIPAVARITGLDPTSSQWGANSLRLRATDATYVEVIHTDGGTFGNGLGVAIGQADFFVNGGSNQPGCFTHSCCHERAHEIFEASFYNPTLVGRRCMTNLQMSLNRCTGESLRLGTNEIPKTGSGSYRVNTRRNFPF